MKEASFDASASMSKQSWTPTLVASTGETYSYSILESRRREDQWIDTEVQKTSERKTTFADDNESNVFKSAEWYACGLPSTSKSLLTPLVGRRTAHAS
jgi:hypothetical protein